MRYVFGMILTFLCVGALFAAGEKETANDAGQEDPVELTIMAPWAEEELEGFRPVMNEFESRNPDITLDYRTGRPEDVATILRGQFASQQTPADVIDTPWAWYIAEQARNGHVMDVTNVINRDDFVSGALSRVTVNGRIYGASSVGGVTIPEYRKSFFEEHNLPDPQTLQSWDEFISLLDQIRQIEGVEAPIASGNGTGWPFTSVVESFILTFGGAEMHQALTRGEIAWTSSQVQGMLEQRLLPMLQNGYFSEPTNWQAAFEGMWQGDYGVYFGDSTDSQMVDSPSDRGVFLLPGQNATVFWYDYWFAPKYSDHPDEAKRLFEFLATEGQAIQVSSGGRIGTYTGIDPNTYPPPERRVFQLIEDVTVVSDMDDTVGGRFQSTIWDQLSLVWADPTEETLSGVLQRVQTALEETLAED